MQRLLPKGGPWGFFGWHLVQDANESIIITEGEYDAMAVAQSLSDLPDNHPLKHIPAVSLPNGCASLPIDLLPRLERFKKIYLWLDNDKPGIEGSDKMARKLGLLRCVIVRPDPLLVKSPKDANDALRMSPDNSLIPSMLEQARILSHEKLISFKDMKSDLIQYLRAETRSEGSQTPSLPKLSSITKGFRRGELVILTGPTGVGKTTVLSQLSLDFVKQGYPTLWGSFEIKNTVLLVKMLSQYSGLADFRSIPNEKMNQIMNDFENLPLKFMSFFGGSDIEHIIEVMDHAIYQDDISHIIIDNLQFMTPRQFSSKSTVNQFEKFDIQDYLIDRFRKFATEKNVNVILVIHPRKVEEDQPLSLASISGTSKATQEADIVLILQVRIIAFYRYFRYITRICETENQRKNLFGCKEESIRWTCRSY